MQSSFRLDRTINHNNTLSAGPAQLPDASSGTSSALQEAKYTKFRVKDAGQGSFEYDVASGKYGMRWDDFGAFEEWLSNEQREQIVEFTLNSTNRSQSDRYDTAYTYVCNRGNAGGKKAYEKKHDYARKLSPKRDVLCMASLYVKTYPDTDAVLGKYNREHTHPIGGGNACYTRLSTETRARIAEMLRMKIQPEHILKLIQGGVYSDPAAAPAGPESRDEFVTMADIKRIENAIISETVRLDQDDGKSTIRWVESLREKDHVLSFKACNDAPAEGSGLDPDSFHVIIQTEWQRERFRESGAYFTAIDGTHNTTQYENMTLFTVLVRDKWGHGVPVAWMISSNGTEATLTHYLRTLRKHNPTVIPKRWMSDKDHAQINAIEIVYPETKVLLCWWHVLHAWQQHFSPTAFPELWSLLKSWIRITNKLDFDKHYSRICEIAPGSFLEYLKTYWMNETEMWSATARVDRNVFEMSDTNMLIEAWHHVLKGKFLGGKRNRRLDFLIHTLHDEVVPYYIAKHRRQLFGFEGPDLEILERVAVSKRAESITRDAVEVLPDGMYRMTSQTTPGVVHSINGAEATCSCFAFSRIAFCKHLFAITRLFPDTASHLVIKPLTAPSASSSDASSGAAVPTDDAQAARAQLNRVREKFHRFLARSMLPSYQLQSDEVQALEDDLDGLLESTATLETLPAKVRIAPNIKSATETARTLPRVKTKARGRKRLREAEPFSGGERAGKKAQPDALGVTGDKENIAPTAANAKTATRKTAGKNRAQGAAHTSAAAASSSVLAHPAPLQFPAPFTIPPSYPNPSLSFTPASSLPPAARAPSNPFTSGPQSYNFSVPPSLDPLSFHAAVPMDHSQVTPSFYTPGVQSVPSHTFQFLPDSQVQPPPDDFDRFVNTFWK